MKKLIAITMCLGITIFLLHGYVEMDKKDENMQPISLIAYEIRDGSIEAKRLEIDYSNNKLCIEEIPIYSMNAKEKLTEERIFPQYISDERLVLREEPISSSYSDLIISRQKNILYYRDYVFTINEHNHKFTIEGSSERVANEFPLIHDGKYIIPSSFFVDEEGNVAILGMTSEELEKSKLVTLLCKRKGDYFECGDVQEYLNIWEKYDLSKTNCPNYTENFVNVNVYSEKWEFLYNETEKLLIFSPYDGTEKCILDESSVTDAMPFLDTHRDYYGFFDGFSAQSDFYLAKIPAYNEIDGTYVIIFNSHGEFLGYVLCNVDGIKLYDEKNQCIDAIQGNYWPNLYIPSV